MPKAPCPFLRCGTRQQTWKCRGLGKGPFALPGSLWEAICIGKEKPCVLKSAPTFRTRSFSLVSLQRRAPVVYSRLVLSQGQLSIRMGLSKQRPKGHHTNAAVSQKYFRLAWDSATCHINQGSTNVPYQLAAKQGRFLKCGNTNYAIKAKGNRSLIAHLATSLGWSLRLGWCFLGARVHPVQSS